MHSRIYQIERAPVDKEDRICADTIPEWFAQSVADYVADVSEENREGEIEWLMSTDFGKVCKRNGNEITFNIDVGAFFDKDFEQFKKAIDDLSKVTFNQFVGANQDVAYDKRLDYLMFLLREAYDDRFGFYVYHCDELYTMQSWMRQVEPCGAYYLGGVVDYHF